MERSAILGQCPYRVLASRSVAANFPLPTQPCSCDSPGTVSALPPGAEQTLSRVSRPREARLRAAWFWRSVLLLLGAVASELLRGCRHSSRIKAQPGLMLVLRRFELEDRIDYGLHLNSRPIENKWTVGPGIHCIERSLPERLRQAHRLKRSRARFTFSIWRMTIVKTSTSYFACASPAITAATLSSIWFQPSS